MTPLERLEKGIPRHKNSLSFKKFIQNDPELSMRWDFGGDGDNGEELLYVLDNFWESWEK